MKPLSYEFNFLAKMTFIVIKQDFYIQLTFVSWQRNRAWTFFEKLEFVSLCFYTFFHTCLLVTECLLRYFHIVTVVFLSLSSLSSTWYKTSFIIQIRRIALTLQACYSTWLNDWGSKNKTDISTETKICNLLQSCNIANSCKLCFSCHWLPQY